MYGVIGGSFLKALEEVDERETEEGSCVRTTVLVAVAVLVRDYVLQLFLEQDPPSLEQDVVIHFHHPCKNYSCIMKRF